MLNGLKTWWAAVQENTEKLANSPEPAILIHVGDQKVVLTGIDKLRYEANNLTSNSGKVLHVKNQLTGRKVSVSGKRVSLVEEIRYTKATKEIIGC